MSRSAHFAFNTFFFYICVTDLANCPYSEISYFNIGYTLLLYSTRCMQSTLCIYNILNSVGQSSLFTRFMLFIPHKVRTMKEGRFKERGLVGNIDLLNFTNVFHFPCLVLDCLSESR